MPGMTRSPRLHPVLLPICVACALLLWGTGCATGPLHSARDQFYRGHITQAEAALEVEGLPGKDPVLFLVERGTIRQAAGHYEESAADFIAAVELLDALETYSLSEGGASLVINDTVQEFQGKPYEQILLHAMGALSYLATGAWDDAAVEARRLVERLDQAVGGGFPDDPYSRYIAGVCFEMIDDPNAATIEYRKASALLNGLAIEEQDGSIHPTERLPLAPSEDLDHELVCFVMLGGDRGRADEAFAEIHLGDQVLGRSYPLTDTAMLASATADRLAVLKAAKTATRVVVKESIAQGLDEVAGDGWGDLARIVLIGILERPDTRRWETLPSSFQVARVPCPADLTNYQVVLQTPGGGILRSFDVSDPIVRRRRTFVSFFRDLPTPR